MGVLMLFWQPATLLVAFILLLLVILVANKMMMMMMIKAGIASVATRLTPEATIADRQSSSQPLDAR